ncbi:major facilitator superfamily domain-containing protein [Circinella umbellata]|nr:major facilitator superfamily domain-containing protein [Circinella umbellata]
MNGFSNTVYYPGIPDVSSDLQASSIAITLSALSDCYKIRQPIIFISMIIYALSSITCGFAYNIWMLVLFRIIQAVGTSSSMAIGGGVLCDIYDTEKRGRASAIFFFGRYIGPIVGPIFGGFLVTSDWKWRASFLFCFSIGSLIAFITFFWMPETYRDCGHVGTVEIQEVAVVENNNDSMLYNTVVEEDIASLKMPHKNRQRIEEQKQSFNLLRPLLLLQYPTILIASLVGAIAFGSLFVFETIIPLLYKQIYGFNGLQIGLCYVGAGVGHILGAFTNGYLSDKLLLRAREKRGGKHNIDDRISANLWPCCLILMPLGSLLFGWGIAYKMPYWVGILGFGVQTFATSQLYSGSSAYLLDSMPHQGASIAATGNFVSMTFAFLLGLVSVPILESTGPGYLSILLASLGWIAAGLLLINKVYGHRIRQHFDLELDEKLEK